MLEVIFASKYKEFMDNCPDADTSLKSLSTFFYLELGKYPEDTRHMRACLLDDKPLQVWLKVFDKHVFPFITTKWF